MVVHNNYCLKTRWNVVYKINVHTVDLLTVGDKKQPRIYSTQNSERWQEKLIVTYLVKKT
jgi:hypothetical protein